MKRAAGKLLALVIALALCAAAACPAAVAVSEAAPPETDAAPAGPMALEINSAAVVYSAAALSAWLANHTEGSVTLGGHIELTTVTHFYGPVTIETGAYGLSFNGGYLAPGFLIEGEVVTPVLDRITLSGEGVAVPVLDVKHMGRMFIGDWNNYLFRLNVTATGRGGAGGTALRISGSGSGTLSFSNLELEEPGLIRSTGTGAVGVELTEAFDLFFFNIAAEGENSAAVYAHKEASINFCRLAASGSGALAVRGPGNITVDNCMAEPAPAQDNVAVYQAALFPRWYPVAQGSDKEVLNWWMLESVSLLHSGPATRGKKPAVTWDMAAYDAISFDEPGSTTLRGALNAAWLRELLPGTPEMIVAVRDPAVPCIQVIGGGAGCHTLYFWTCDAWGPEDCILWISDDEGKTWRDCTEDDGVLWQENNVAVPEGMIDEGVMLVLEVPGFGFSNVAHFSYEYGQFVGDIGGDRVGTDRISVSLGGEKPPPFIGQPNGPDDTDEDEGEEPAEPPRKPGSSAGRDKYWGSTAAPVEAPVSPDEGALPPEDADGGDPDGTDTAVIADGGADEARAAEQQPAVWELPVPAAPLPAAELMAVGVNTEAISRALPLREAPAAAPQAEAAVLVPPPIQAEAGEDGATADAAMAVAGQEAPEAQPPLSKEKSGATVAIAVTASIVLVAVGGWLLPARLRVFRK